MLTLKEIAFQIGLNYNYLLTLYINSDKFYKTYFIKKKSGKNRLIASPNYEIKAIQSWILREHLEKIEISDHATGFKKGRSIKLNASVHLQKKFLMCLDIENFFPSISFEKIDKLLNFYHYSKEVSKFFAKIATYKGSLPQGGVTSPLLSNIVFLPIDKQLANLCSKKNINYSRYADDLTFSSDYKEDLKEIKKEVESIIKKEGFKLNTAKFRFMSGQHRKIVTGILLNSGRLTVQKEYKKLVRAAMFNHIIKEDKSVNMNEIFGLISFIGDIEPNYYERIKDYKFQLEAKKRILMQ